LHRLPIAPDALRHHTQLGSRAQNDRSSRRASLTLPDGQQQTWNYDPAGRANQLTQPGGAPKTWTAGYDGDGNLQ
jgi:YD repeat-containing protein